MGAGAEALSPIDRKPAVNRGGFFIFRTGTLPICSGGLESNVSPWAAGFSDAGQIELTAPDYY